MRLLGLNSWYLGDFQQAVLLCKQSAAIYRDVGDNNLYAACIFQQGLVALSVGFYSEARQHTETALAFGRELSDKAIIAEAQLTQARMDWLSGEDVQAILRVEEARNIIRELNDPWGSGNLLGHLTGQLALGKGDLPSATAHFKESLQDSTRKGQWQWSAIVLSLNDLASLAVRSGNMERAARLFGAAERAFPGLVNTLSPIERGWREQDVQSACAALGEEEYKKQTDLGRQLSLEQATTYALEDR
jgi:tetratricopeptide (TPR) repeat protein